MSSSSRTLRLVCLSDTHGMHRKVVVPDGDILIHAGDLTVFDQPVSDALEVLTDVNVWLGELPHRHKVVIAGNHDRVFQEVPKRARAILTHAHYLENSGITLEGIRFWGSPITPVLEGMAFATERGSASRKVWDLVPSNTEVLITHGPPYGTCDQVQEWSTHWGCNALLETVLRIQPRLHVFGHVHGGYGRQSNRHGSWFINCAVINHERVLANSPVVIEYQLS